MVENPQSSLAPRFSDLVVETRLNTEFLAGGVTQHVFYRTGRSARERRLQIIETWEPYDKEPILGRGAYGVVRLERCVETEGEIKMRAVKEIRKTNSHHDAPDYTRELETIMKFSSPKFSHCFVESFGWFDNESSVFITMEYLPLGDLQRHLVEPLPQDEVNQIVSQLVEGLGYMHSSGFVHRDLKPSNIMVVTQGPDWFVKIADFGISKRKRWDAELWTSLPMGTIAFAAPEQLGLTTPRNGNNYGFAADLWSLGVIAFKLLTNKIPFPSLSALSTFISGEGPFPSDMLQSAGVATGMQNIITNLLSKEPGDRPTIAECGMYGWGEISDEKGGFLVPLNGNYEQQASIVSSVPSADWTEKAPWTEKSDGRGNDTPLSQATTKFGSIPLEAVRSQGSDSMLTGDNSILNDLEKMRFRMFKSHVKAHGLSEDSPHLNQLLGNSSALEEIERGELHQLTADAIMNGSLNGAICFRFPEVRQLVARMKYKAMRPLARENAYVEIVDLLSLYRYCQPRTNPGRTTGSDERLAAMEVSLVTTLSVALIEAGQTREAILILDSLLRGSDLRPPEKGNAQHAITKAFIKVMDWGLAKEHGIQAANIFREIYGPQHAMTLLSLESVALACRATKDPDESLWREMIYMSAEGVKDISPIDGDAQLWDSVVQCFPESNWPLQQMIHHILISHDDVSIAADESVRYLKQTYSTAADFQPCGDCMKAYILEYQGSLHVTNENLACQRHQTDSTAVIFSPLHFFAAARHSPTGNCCVEEVKHLFEAAQYQSTYLNSPLRNSKGEVVEVKRTALWLAAIYGNYKVVEYLLSLDTIDVLEGIETLSLFPRQRLPQKFRDESIGIDALVRAISAIPGTAIEGALVQDTYLNGSYIPIPWSFINVLVLQRSLAVTPSGDANISFGELIRPRGESVKISPIWCLANIVLTEDTWVFPRLELSKMLIAQGASLKSPHHSLGAPVQVVALRLAEAARLLSPPHGSFAFISRICREVSTSTQMIHHMLDHEPQSGWGSELSQVYVQLTRQLERPIKEIRSKYGSSLGSIRGVFKTHRKPEASMNDLTSEERIIAAICISVEGDIGPLIERGQYVRWQLNRRNYHFFRELEERTYR